MKVTLDLPRNAERDLTRLGAEFGSIQDATCTALAVGVALLLKNPELVEKAKASYQQGGKAKRNKQKAVAA